MGKISIKKQIEMEIRERIASGEWKPGDRIPVTQQWADRFNTSLANAHKAMVQLVREGLLLRINTGTVVNAPSIRMTCMAVCITKDPLRGNMRFLNFMANACREELARRDMTARFIYNDKPQNLIRELNSLAALGKIQGAILTSSDQNFAEELKKLNIPYAELSSRRARNAVHSAPFSNEVFRKLKHMGIRKIAMVSSFSRFEEMNFPENLPTEHFSLFRKRLGDFRIELPEENLFRLDHDENHSRFAYEKLGLLLSRPREQWPDLIWLDDDNFVDGAMIRFYQNRICIPEDIRLLILVNEGMYPLLPVPCHLLILPVPDCARLLVDRVMQQFRNEHSVPGHYQIRFEEYIPNE